MRLFIDCEWNSYKGELLSFALVSEDGQAFYMLLPEPSEAIDHNQKGKPMPIVSSSDYFYTRVARALFAERSRKNLSQLDLAKLSGVNHSHISLIESVERRPSLEALRKLAKALDMSLHDLIPSS